MNQGWKSLFLFQSPMYPSASVSSAAFQVYSLWPMLGLKFLFLEPHRSSGLFTDTTPSSQIRENGDLRGNGRQTEHPYGVCEAGGLSGWASWFSNVLARPFLPGSPGLWKLAKKCQVAQELTQGVILQHHQCFFQPACCL